MLWTLYKPACRNRRNAPIKNAGQAYAVAYAYDLADRVIGIVYPDNYPSGRIVTYVRDAQGRVTSVTTNQNATAAMVTLAQNIAWQPFSGLVSSMTYGNGLLETDTYSLDYEINRLLVQNGAASVQDNVCALLLSKVDAKPRRRTPGPISRQRARPWRLRRA